MATRYLYPSQLPIHANGNYVSFAEYEEMSRELMEAADDLFDQLASGQLTAAEAKAGLRAICKVLDS